MDRKDFLKKGLLGTSMLVTASALGNVVKNDSENTKEVENRI